MHTHPEDRNDVGVVQERGGPGLALESDQLDRSHLPSVGQDLERHVPAQALLLGLVHDAHAAPANLAQDFVPRQHEPRGPFGQVRDGAGQPIRFPVRIDGVVVGDLRDFCPAMAVVKVQHDQLAGQDRPRGLVDAFEIIADRRAQATFASRLEPIAHRIEALGHGQGQGRDVRASGYAHGPRSPLRGEIPYTVQRRRIKSSLRSTVRGARRAWQRSPRWCSLPFSIRQSCAGRHLPGFPAAAGTPRPPGRRTRAWARAR